MSLFTEYELKSVKNSYRDYFQKSASTIINEERNLPISHTFDIFLSHSYLDKDVILGLNAELEKMDYSIYIDWIADDELDRRKVTKETAKIIRQRMENSKCLFFATSLNSQISKWMPWECGYFDGLKGKVAILPVAKTLQSTFNGQEYLGLYPYVDKVKPQNGSKKVLWINESTNVYTSFEKWLKGEKPYLNNS